MAKLIKADGEITQIVPENGSKFTLEELQHYVGGYIEARTSTIEGMMLIMNEEGRDKRLPLNEQATLLLHKTYSFSKDKRTSVVGDVVLAAIEELN